MHVTVLITWVQIASIFCVASAGFDAAGSNPADCCKICKNTDLCNAWVFCNQREGCGPKGSCSAYINSLNATAMRQDASSARLPIIGWGSFGGRCNEDGRWQYCPESVHLGVAVAQVSPALLQLIRRWLGVV